MGIKTAHLGTAVVLFILVLAFQATLASASDHYTFEHAEEMRVSGRIEWRNYSSEPFLESVEENKPIFLLLTAPSWCYWCHVYTSDDYIYHPDVYPVINEKFIPIYVDADKRQDLTRKFLEGGWPSTTVLTPSRERMYGYSGPRPVQNMLANLESASTYVQTTGFSDKVSYNYQPAMVITPTEQQLNSLINGFAGYVSQVYDPVNGGFGSGQKFPQGRSLDFSLELYELTGNTEWLSLVQNTLRNQYTEIDEIETNYNLFDPVEGGFHRYGTRPDWTPPHYEKMLYDNARLLKAYSHLQQLTPDDELVQEVVRKTLEFIELNWYDENQGGFYGNSDVHGEDAYYGKAERDPDKPRVEKTKYSDWNADAILTYLDIWETSQNEKHRKMAAQSLDFFRQNMVTEKGAYHYYRNNGEKGVTGSLLDNSYLLLAFVEGYEVLGQDAYLDTAINLADFGLDNLYDWNSGGFFERNSPDTELYAPGENLDLSKPPPENAIMAYGMLKLYELTDDPRYLIAGTRTIGAKISEAPGLDRGYYFAKTAQFMLVNNLLADFESLQPQVAELEAEKQQSFWLNDIISTQPSLQPVQKFVASGEGLEKLGAPIWLLIPVALLAGFISFASPCTLPVLPAYIAYSFKSSKTNIKGMTIAFFLGLSVVFTLLGMSATLIGGFLRSNLAFFSQIAGVAVMLFGIYILLGLGLPGLKVKRKPTSYLGSFFFGSVLALSWTPCVGPILVALLLLASTTGSALTGGLLLFLYGLGLALPLIIISTYLGKINRESTLWKVIEGKELHLKFGGKSFSIHTSSLISGMLFLILGYLIFSGILFAFNQYVAATSFQKFIFGFEDWLLNVIK